MKKLIIVSLMLSGCGFNGNQRATIGGFTNSQISIVFQFIQQVEDLCRMQNSAADFPTIDAYNKAVADCTFKNLSIININQVCSPTTSLTPQQQTVCNGLSKP